MTPKIDTLKGALGIFCANDASKCSVRRDSHTRQDVPGSASRGLRPANFLSGGRMCAHPCKHQHTSSEALNELKRTFIVSLFA